ncbi:MAG: S-layer homology domain-containing protein [Candidatus Gracilibacteria bacterium]|jgi:hypothetical protein
MNPKKLFTFTATLFALFSILFPYLASAGESPYTDDDQFNSHFEAIYQMKEAGVFSGYPDGTFRGQIEINRAELAKVLVLASGITEDTVASCADNATKTFSDMEEGAWYTDYIYCAQAKGWVNGDGGKDTVRPGDPVLLGETFKMVVESQYGTPSGKYLVSGEQWYMPYVNFLSDHKIILVPSTSGEIYYRYTYSGLHDSTASVGFDSTTESKTLRADIAELLYRIKSISNLDSDEIFNPILTLDEYAETYGATVEEKDGFLSVADPHFGYRFENLPLKNLNGEEVLVYPANPSGFENGYTSYLHFIYPSEEGGYSGPGYFGTGYDRFFYVEVDSVIQDWDIYWDFSSQNLEYKFDCSVGMSTSVSEILSQPCVVDENQNVDAAYVNFSAY